MKVIKIPNIKSIWTFNQRQRKKVKKKCAKAKEGRDKILKKGERDNRQWKQTGKLQIRLFN